MRKIFYVALLCAFTLSVSAQEPPEDDARKSSLTVGFLQGGGSLIGADFEFLVSENVGLQIGAGYVGFGGGINYHLKPYIRSSFLTVQYWNQGFGDSFTQNILGAGYTFRGKKWFTFHLGIGFPLSKGPAWPLDRVQTPVMLTYSIGAYFPI